MSYTNNDLIADSLREIGVITEIQTPSAEQGAHSLRKFNQLMAEYGALDGFDLILQWFEQTSLSDACPLADDLRGGVTALLATRLAPNYGASVSIELAAAAAAGHDHLCRLAVKAALQAHTLVNRPDGEALNGSGFNILTG